MSLPASSGAGGVAGAGSSGVGSAGEAMSSPAAQAHASSMMSVAMPPGPAGSIGTGGMAGISGISGSIVMGGSMHSMMPGMGPPLGGIAGPNNQGGSSTYIRMRNGSSQMPESNSKRREIGDLAVWTLSSAKQGNGVEQLRDNQISTFWQSDGQQPHFISI